MHYEEQTLSFQCAGDVLQGVVTLQIGRAHV